MKPMHNPVTMAKNYSFLPGGVEGKAKKSFSCSSISGLCSLGTNKSTEDQSTGPPLVHQGLAPARAINSPLSNRRKHVVHCIVTVLWRWNIAWALRKSRGISWGLRQYFIVYPSSCHNTVTRHEIEEDWKRKYFVLFTTRLNFLSILFVYF